MEIISIACLPVTAASGNTADIRNAASQGGSYSGYGRDRQASNPEPDNPESAVSTFTGSDSITFGADAGRSAAREFTEAFSADSMSVFRQDPENSAIWSEDFYPAGAGSLRDENLLTEETVKEKSRLNQTQDSGGGAAYGIMKDSRLNRPVNDLSKDQILRRQADLIFSPGSEQESSLMADCEKITEKITGNAAYHIPDLRACTRLTERAGECSISHELYAEPVIGLLSSGLEGLDNSANIMPCEDEDNCLLIFTGSEYRDNHGRCLEYRDRLRVAVYHPEAISGIRLWHAAWDDFWGSWITGSDGIIHPLLLPTFELPVRITDPAETENPEAWDSIRSQGWAIVDRLDHDRLVNSINCENTWHGSSQNCTGGGRCRGYDFNRSRTEDGADLLSLFRNASPEKPVVIDSVTSTEDDGRYRLKIKIYYNPAKITVRESWSPASCISLAAGISDGKSTGSVVCREELPGIVTASDGSRIIMSSGFALPLDHRTVPVPGIDTGCRTADVSARGFYSPAGDSTGDCSRYENECGFVSSKCSDSGVSGNCYAYDEVYDCGSDYESKEHGLKVNYFCGGEIRCLGTECSEGTYNVSRSFARVSALLQAADFMAQDMECSGLDSSGRPTGQEDVICRIFSGRVKNCTRSLKGAGGLEVDCCDCPPGVSLASYLRGILLISRIDSAVAGMDHSSVIYGAYSEMRRPLFNLASEIGNRLKTVTRPFTSWFENTTGMKGLFSSDKSIVEYVKDKLKSKAREILKEIFGEARDKLSAEGAAAGGGSGSAGAYGEGMSDAVLETASSALAVVGYVYMVYQISCLVSSMLFRCEPEQLELAAQRSLKNCSYVGQYCSKKVLKHCISKTYSYCCFSSPLSRIIQEQIRQQLGTPFMSMDPKAPVWTGLTPDELEKVDWEKISLDEWTALLKITGNYEGDRVLSSENLTGAGTALDFDYSDSEIGESSRTGVVDRTLERVFDLDFDRIRKDTDRGYMIETE